MTTKDIPAQFSNPDERADAERVEKGVRALLAGDEATAEALLTEVAGRIPRDYVFQQEQDGELFIKFWDKEEFLHYVLWHKRQGIEKRVSWIISAYPRACYFLGFLQVKRGDYTGAIEWLDRGAALEPTNPSFRLEKAQAFAQLKRHQEALSLFESIGQPGPYVSPHAVAMALRGQGFVHVEMGHLDPAVAAYRKSLEFEPGNEIARHELNYIEHLRRGGAASATGVATTRSPDTTRCAVCGQKANSGRLIDLDGKAVLVCDRCVRKATKRWWEFWK